MNNIEFGVGGWYLAYFAVLKGYHHQVTLHTVYYYKILNNVVINDVGYVPIEISWGEW